jgi:hypothetical protein
MTLPYQGEDAIETGSVHNENWDGPDWCVSCSMAFAVLASG